MVWLCLAPFLCSSSAEVSSSLLSFSRDIRPVLTKAGCNLGACHGAATGKGRLGLSLRGENPGHDHEVLSRTFIDVGSPERSLLLRKALQQVPHEGGLRFQEDSESHRLILAWIQQGAPLHVEGQAKFTKLEVTPTSMVLEAPLDRIRLQAEAIFEDGTRVDVSRWAIYEASNLLVDARTNGEILSLRPGETTVTVRYMGIHVPVRLAFIPARPGYVWHPTPVQNPVDVHLQSKWQSLRLLPSGLVDDTTFIRRVYLDLTGAIPSGEEALAFVQDRDPAKRSRLVDRLLSSPSFADFWALKWADLLRVEEKVLDRQGVEVFHAWIRESLLINKPLDQFCREILEARGSTYGVPPANYYRALRSADQRSEAVAQIFLGTRLNCAKCHNHPFERWTMDDYYGFAAVFDGIDYDILENKRFDKNDKNNFVGEQVVKLVPERTLKDPRSGRLPELRFLGEGESLANPSERLESLGHWLTSPENPLFARVQANRIWAHLMGRGLVDPVDDFRTTNPPVNPELLDALTEALIQSGFDGRHLIRLICNSRAYQLSSQPNETNAEDMSNFSRGIPRRMGAEQILDAVHQVLGTLPSFEGYPEPMKAIQVPGIRAVYRPKSPTPGDRFLHLFGKPPRLTNSDTERVQDPSLAQVFELTSGPSMQQRLSDRANALGGLLERYPEPEDLVDALWWRTLTRMPSLDEKTAAANHLLSAQDRRMALEDLVWALLNAKEFLLRP